MNTIWVIAHQIRFALCDEFGKGIEDGFTSGLGAIVREHLDDQRLEPC